jgi:hypothetical protein
MSKKGLIKIVFKFKVILKIINNLKYILKIKTIISNFHQQRIILEEEILISFKQLKLINQIYYIKIYKLISNNNKF